MGGPGCGCVQFFYLGISLEKCSILLANCLYAPVGTCQYSGVACGWLYQNLRQGIVYIASNESHYSPLMPLWARVQLRHCIGDKIEAEVWLLEQLWACRKV